MRGDLGAVAGHRIGDAGARRHAVDQHRAGAADAVLAAEMRAGQVAAARAGNRRDGCAARRCAGTGLPLTVSEIGFMRAAACRIARAAARRRGCAGRARSPSPALDQQRVGRARDRTVREIAGDAPPNSARASASTIGCGSIAPITTRHTSRARIDQHGADRMGEFAGLAADLVVAPAGRCRQAPARGRLRAISSGASAVSSAPVMKSSTATVRAPAGAAQHRPSRRAPPAPTPSPRPDRHG